MTTPQDDLDAAAAARAEETICTCGAGHGSTEGHLHWCAWIELCREFARTADKAEPVAWRGRVRFSPGQNGWEYAYKEQTLIDRGFHERQPLYALASSPAASLGSEGTEADLAQAIFEAVTDYARPLAALTAIRIRADHIAATYAALRATPPREDRAVLLSLIADLDAAMSGRPNVNDSWWRDCGTIKAKLAALLPSGEQE